jgi:glyoxylase-like metal-dependent hydrolase (beta-lactamase superfamily II)
MTGPGTNAYAVGTGPRAVIDPGAEDDAFLDEVIEAAEGDVKVILVTHRHPDHVEGAACLGERTGAPVRAFGDMDAGGCAVDPLADGEAIGLGEMSLVAVHAPGHARDHVCFFEPHRRALFSGDNVLGEGTAVIAPPDGDMGDYMATLRRLRALDPRWIYPGHFRPLHRGTETIDAYIAHREQREAAILEVLDEGPASVDAIVARVYSDVDPSLHGLARLSVQAHLDLAARHGRVRAGAGAWERTERAAE